MAGGPGPPWAGALGVPPPPKGPATSRVNDLKVVSGSYFFVRDQYWSRGERVPVPGPSRALPTPMLWEAGERPGSVPSRSKGLSAAPQRRGAA